MLEERLAVGGWRLAVGEGTEGIDDLRLTRSTSSGQAFDESGTAMRDARCAMRPKVRRTPYPRLDWNGHRVVARSGHVGRSLRGNEATDIVVDEAAFVPEKLISEVVFPMLATTNGTLTLVSTPCGMNHFWRWFRMGQEGLAVGGERLAEGEERGKTKRRNDGTTGEEGGSDARCAMRDGVGDTTNRTYGTHGTNGDDAVPAEIAIWSKQAPSWESPYVSKEFLEAQKELISERAFRVEYGAEFLDSSGRVFRTEAIEGALVAEFWECAGEGCGQDLRGPGCGRNPTEEAPSGEAAKSGQDARGPGCRQGCLRSIVRHPEPPFCIGIDWARYTDFTAVAVLSGTRKGARLVCAERFHGMPWPELVDGVAAICERYSDCVAVCDATGVGDSVEGMLRRRAPWLRLRREVFTGSTKAHLADNLAWMLENGRFKMRPHPELIRELQHFEAVASDSGHVKLGAPAGFHDDLVVALGLACTLLPSDEEMSIHVGKARSFDFAQDDGGQGNFGLGSGGRD
jgi:hypothetical protein